MTITSALLLLIYSDFKAERTYFQISVATSYDPVRSFDEHQQSNTKKKLKISSFRLEYVKAHPIIRYSAGDLRGKLNTFRERKHLKGPKHFIGTIS